MKPASPYLTVPEAAAYVRKTPHAFACLRSRLKAEGKSLRCYRLRGLVYFKQADLDALFTDEKPIKLRAVPGALRGVRRSA